jgi:hypothetical protein
MSSFNAFELRNALWQFVAGETSVDQFREWLYETNALQGFLGDEVYLDVVSADYGVAEVVERVRRVLIPFVRSDIPAFPEYLTIAALAAKVLAGGMRAGEAARRLSALRFIVSEDGRDDDFDIFVLLDSETHHLPVGAERDVLWAPAVLPKLGAELRRIEEGYRSEVLESCARLVARFGPVPTGD